MKWGGVVRKVNGLILCPGMHTNLIYCNKLHALVQEYTLTRCSHKCVIVGVLISNFGGGGGLKERPNKNKK